MAHFTVNRIAFALVIFKNEISVSYTTIHFISRRQISLKYVFSGAPVEIYDIVRDELILLRL